jgi:hypothetical protein
MLPSFRLILQHKFYKIFRMRKLLLLFFGALLVFAGCKEKETEKKEGFFPVLSFIQSQVADIDTSLYSIKKIIIYDSAHADTSWVKREEFRGLARDFLELPDLNSKKLSKLYTEEKQFDENLNRFYLFYKPVHAEKAEIQNQQVIIKPDIATGDKVLSIIVEKGISNKDSSVQKTMLWQVDKSFQVTTMTQKPGQPETIHTMKISWNEDDEE